ncbi:FTR1 family iron permease [Virgibacillus flavescens]|uniref:FTR1 family iron permease n=1 Tax=Virgibacillus flavescens TaxID=1611422 RepID=UPI003D3253FB
MRKISFMAMLLSLFSFYLVQPALAAESNHVQQKLLPIVEKAEELAAEGRIDKVRIAISEFHELWEQVEHSIEENAPHTYEEIEAAMAKAEGLIQSNNPDSEQVGKAITKLEAAIAGSEQKKATSNVPGATALLGLSRELEEAIELVDHGEWDHAIEEYEEFHSGWESVEDTIQSTSPESYKGIETTMGLVNASLEASSNPEKAKQYLSALLDSIKDFANKNTATSSPAKNSGEKNIETLVNLLEETKNAIESGDNEVATREMEAFISVWPTVEGKVSTKSASVYEDTENNMTHALGLLMSNPPKMDEASEVVVKMKSQLNAITNDTTYSIWDAAIILLREGLEIILILAALLAFLTQSGNKEKRVWIWGGAAAGAIASVGLAFLLTSVLSAATSAQNRELMEGITGLIAVVLMFTVGAWLHGKSNIKNWNNYIHESVGSAIARGSLWSLAGVAFLTVVREGAETIIFYTVMVPSISTDTLLSGIGIALLILAVVGIAIMYFSVKLPIRLMFLSITFLIYYLAFKFTGESIHALQVVGKLPAHTIESVSDISWLGFYPTWETSIAQITLLLLIGLQMTITNRLHSSKNSSSKRIRAEQAR